MNQTSRSDLAVNPGKLLLIAGMTALPFLLYQLNLMQVLDVESLASRRAVLDQYHQLHPYSSALAFFMTCVVLTGLSLPVTGLLMIAAGVIFGLFWGTLIMSFASAIGSTIAFLSSRYLLHDFVQKHFSKHLEKINSGIEADGVLYLLLLRQAIIFPSFLVNILMGLTPISVRRFYLGTQVGMFAITALFVNAGSHIANISSPADILSLPVIISFMLAGLFPLLAKKLFLSIKNRNTQHKGT